MHQIFKLWYIVCYLSTNLLLISGNINVNRTSANHHNIAEDNVATPSKQRIKIAGLFSIHLKKNGKECSTDINPTNYQMAEAMRFAIQQINNNNALLPTIQLDYVIDDTCGIVKNSVKSSMGYSFVTKYFERNDTCMQENEVTLGDSMVQQKSVETVAIIGPYGSEESRAVTDFTALFHIPVVSPTASSKLLSNEETYPYFLRTVPSDTFQVKAITHLLKYFKWNFVILLVSDDEYGRSARLAFKEEQLKSENRFCTEIDEIIDRDNIPTIYEKLKQAEQARVIILFANSEEAKALIRLADTVDGNNKLRDFTWVAPDSWNKNPVVTSGRENFLKGMIGISPYEIETAGFREYFINSVKESVSSQSTSNNQSVKWANEYVNSKECVSLTSNINCTNETLLAIAPYEITSTVNAVLATAKAIHQILDCNATWCNHTVESVDWRNLISYIRDIEFVDASNKTIILNESRINHIEYNIWNLQERNGKFEYIEIGRWRAVNRVDLTLDIYDENDIQWNTGLSIVPNSSCSETCEKGQHKIFYNAHTRCCWNCSVCKQKNTYTDTINQAKCKTCPKYHVAHQHHTGCIEIEVNELYIKLTDSLTIVFVACSCSGILALLLTLVIFLCYRDTPVIKASNRSLSYIIMLGAAVLFLLPLTNIGKMTSFRCKVFPLTIGLALVLNIGTLLIKTNRIARIFSRKIVKKRKARCLSLPCQYMMVGVLVAIEFCICVVWEFILVPPQLHSEVYNGVRVTTCSLGKHLLGFVIWSMYNAGLILSCTYQAFLVRNVPTNYNEAKFIAFTVFTLCIIIIAYVPVYFGTVIYHRDLIGSFLYIFAATVEFSCLFAPKLYIVILRPDKNKTMEQIIHSHSPLTSKNLSRYFEAESDYFPTEQELDLLKMDKYKSPYRKEQFTSPLKSSKNRRPKRHITLDPTSTTSTATTTTTFDDLSSVFNVAI